MNLDPRPFTIRQLILMTEGRDRYIWNVASVMMALVANCHRDSKHKAFTANDFNPTYQKHSEAILITDENIDLMKNEFIKANLV